MNEDKPCCELCLSKGGLVLWESPSCRVVRVDDPYYPGFCRVIWNDHVAEMTELVSKDQIYLMRVVFAVETMVKQLFSPDKVNLASLGNVVPHLHWHVIPRWKDDRHYPEPIWGNVQREGVRVQPKVNEGDMRDLLIAAINLTNDVRNS